MGTSQAARAPKTVKWNQVPSALRSPARNASTVVAAVVSATLPRLPGGAVATPAYYAVSEGVRFVKDAREHGLRTAAQTASLRVSEKYVASSVAGGLWNLAVSRMDPRTASTPYARLAEVAFKKTVSAIIVKGEAAMGEG